MQTSERFGLWRRLARLGKYSDCICDCGTRRKVVDYDLRNGKSTNCGCQRFPHMRAAQKAAVTTHGMSGGTSAEYGIWVDMRRRCYQQQRPDFKNYGGRGITVCDRWRNDFTAFYADMGQRPKGYTLERRDNDGPYEPSNCYWAPVKTQAHNKRTSRFIVVDGKRMTVAAAADAAGIPRHTVYGRVNAGWPSQDLLIPPLTRQQRVARRNRHSDGRLL